MDDEELKLQINYGEGTGQNFHRKFLVETRIKEEYPN